MRDIFTDDCTMFSLHCHAMGLLFEDIAVLRRPPVKVTWALIIIIRSCSPLSSPDRSYHGYLPAPESSCKYKFVHTFFCIISQETSFRLQKKHPAVFNYLFIFSQQTVRSEEIPNTKSEDSVRYSVWQ